MKVETMSDCCGTGAKNGKDRYDLVVIGAGSAGFSAAITAAEQGAQVALVGHGTMGGTCVNVGCVPSKALIRATEAVHHANAASRFAGIDGNARVADWQALVAQKDDLVASLRQAKYVDLLPAYNNVAYHEGQARLVDGGVQAGGKRLVSDRIITMREGKVTGELPRSGATPKQPSIGVNGKLQSRMRAEGSSSFTVPASASIAHSWRSRFGSSARIAGSSTPGASGE